MIKYTFILLPILCGGWTQNIFTYINTNSRQPVINLMEILSLSGLIEQEHYSKNTSIQQIFYESDTLLEPSKDITTVHKTLTSNKNTQIEILIETKNYFIASPHYIGSGIIYDRSLSKEQHGRLIFFVRTTSGPISIRIFSPDGQLQREEIWHIEVR